MSKDREPYSRIYWTVMADAKFDGIREDTRLFGAWSLMLVVADMAYPAPAFIPPGVSRASLARLVEAELVDLVGTTRYQIHGLAKERERRSEAGRAGGLASGRSRTVDTPANDRSTIVEQPLDKGPRTIVELDKGSSKGKDEAEAETPRAPDPADVYWTLTGRYPTDKALSWIDDLSSSYGVDAVIRALATTHQQDRSGNTLLGRTEDVLRHDARALTLKEQAAVRATIKERRSEPRAEIDQAALQAEIRRLMQPGAAA